MFTPLHTAYLHIKSDKRIRSESTYNLKTFAWHLN